MIGDSVTDAERSRPVGEGLFDPMGKGYVNMVAAILGAFCPAAAIRVVNMGCSGNTVLDLQARWDADVLALRPDWVSIMIGINDVWRQFDLPRHKEIHVLPEAYRTAYEALLIRTKPQVKGMILLTPFFIEPQRGDAMRQRMDEYGAIVKELARRHGLPCIDTQAAFDRHTQLHHSGSIAWDRVHPNQTGHMILARAFLEGIGFSWKTESPSS